MNMPPIVKKEVFTACENGDISVINKNIKRNFNLDFVNEDGETPLIIATIFNKFDIVEALCKYKKTDINAIDYDGYSALFRAVIDNNKEIVELLLSHGANYINIVDSMFPMSYAVMMGFNDIVRLLYKYGDQVPNNYLGLSRKRIRREEPVKEKPHKLFSSITNNDIEGVLQCIKEGYNVNETFLLKCMTPIIYATELGNLEIIKILCENGGDHKLFDSTGVDAYFVADICDHQDILCYFNSLKK